MLCTDILRRRCPSPHSFSFSELELRLPATYSSLRACLSEAERLPSCMASQQQISPPNLSTRALNRRDDLAHYCRSWRSSSSSSLSELSEDVVRSFCFRGFCCRACAIVFLFCCCCCFCFVFLFCCSCCFFSSCSSVSASASFSASSLKGFRATAGKEAIGTVLRPFQWFQIASSDSPSSERSNDPRSCLLAGK